MAIDDVAYSDYKVLKDAHWSLLGKIERLEHENAALNQTLLKELARHPSPSLFLLLQTVETVVADYERSGETDPNLAELKLCWKRWSEGLINTPGT